MLMLVPVYTPSQSHSTCSTLAQESTATATRTTEMASSDSGKLINHALNQVRLMIESDTEVSTIDLNLLENLNTNQSLNYIKLEQELSALETNAGHISEAKRELQELLVELNEIEQSVVKLSQITDELHGWTKELSRRS